MPIEIREVIIKTTINSGNKRVEASSNSSNINIEFLKKQIIEEVLQEVERKLER